MTVLIERDEPIAVVRLNRPEQLNALSNQLMSELVGALENLDDDDAVRCILLAGDDKAFASGADIAELSDGTHLELYFGGRIDKWDAIRSVRTPIVAAVSGYCLGGGCELAMACDLIIASESAQFGQPETNLGVLAGAGGTQRLTRAIGKSKAMDVVLTGRGSALMLPFRAHERHAHDVGAHVPANDGTDRPADNVFSAANLFQDFRELRGIQVSGRTGLDPGIPALRDERR
jgi:enoyl-CoA hydratase/carnithine racemase